MYATAHRVRSSQGAVGINAFLHEHGGTIDAVDWAAVSISRITDNEPGAMVAQATDVAPGGNSVLSYLDVVAPDGTFAAEVEAALRLLGPSLLAGMLPSEARIGNISLRFGATFGLQSAAPLEYQALAERTVKLVRERPAPGWLGRPPIEIVGTLRDGSLSLSLDGPSRERLGAETVRGLPSTVSVDIDVQTGFQGVHGDVLLHIVPMLTGLSLNDAAQMGGVRVRMTDRPGSVWEWPRR